MQHKLFSLNISLKIEDLIITTIYCDKKVDFNRLRESLRKGDYRFFSPIGLVSVLTDRSFYIICPKNIEDINGQIEKVNFTISKDKNRILLKDSSFWVNTNLMVWEGLCDFLLTLIYINANTFGYDYPRNVRSFFNKKTKGILSKRGEKFDILEVHDQVNRKNKRIFTLHEALSIKTWYKGKNTILLIPFPRFEVRENKFTYPIEEEFYEEEIKSKWSTYLLQKSETIIQNLNSINTLLIESMKRMPYINTVIENNECIDCFTLKISDLELENNKKINIPAEERFDEFLRKNFIYDKSNTDLINIIADLNQSSENWDQVTLFLKNLEEDTGFKANVMPSSLINVIKSENFNTLSHPTLYIINDLDKKSENGVYRLLKYKQSEYPHKIIQLSTIFDYVKNPSSDILYQVFLPLLHRSKSYIPWHSVNSTFSLIVGCVQSSRMGGSVSIYSISAYSKNNFLITGDYEYRYVGFNDNLEEKIRNFLNDQNLNKMDNVLILFHGTVFSKPKITGNTIKAISSFNCNIITAYIDENEQGRITKESGNDKNPDRGFCYYLGTNSYFHNYLCITTGFPDIKDNDIDIGFTRPVLVQISKDDLSQNPNLTIKHILQAIFDFSHMHPTSFKQSSLPFPLYSAIKGLNVQNFLIGKKEPFSYVKGVL